VSRVLIFGTGAMACALGGALARRGGTEVTLAGTWPEGLAALRGCGVRVERGDDAWSAPVRAVPVSEAPPAARILVAVKAHQTASVVPFVARSAAADGLVVSLQNGLGPLPLLREAVGPHRLAGGVATFGATLVGPGHVRVFPGEVLLGHLGTADSHLQDLAAELTAAGIPTRLVEDLDAAVWTKLAVNCAINPVTALSGLRNGDLLAAARWLALLKLAAAEVGEVARARGIPLPDDPVERALAVARATAPNRSSMLQDLDRGAPTEIDALCGAVVLEARRLGIEAPVNEYLLEAVKAREALARGRTASTVA
jgi:2-dehydropantoate 2-reductase